VGAFGVKRPLGHQLVDPLTGLERGVELEQRLGPEQPQAQVFLDPFGDARVADVHEAADVLGVLPDQAVADGEDVHGCALGRREGPAGGLPGERRGSEASGR
jgi:hypothetical protein